VNTTESVPYFQLSNRYNDLISDLLAPGELYCLAIYTITWTLHAFHPIFALHIYLFIYFIIQVVLEAQQKYNA